jgi:hypothetical protein
MVVQGPITVGIPKVLINCLVAVVIREIAALKLRNRSLAIPPLRAKADLNPLATSDTLCRVGARGLTD